MNRTRWIIFGVICLAVLGLLIVINKKNDTTTNFTGDSSKIITDGPIADHVFGPSNQKVVLIEYGDYQCPACGAMYQTVKDITTTYKDKLTFIFRNFPLTNIHPNALSAAAAAEAAGLQGKYYEMHDKLYEMQSNWSDASISNRSTLFEQYAQSVGLNIDQYRQALSSADITTKISRDQATARTFNTDATPTFILNGQKMSNDVSTNPTNFEKAIKDALQQAGFSLDN